MADKPHFWYGRPVFFVTDVNRSLAFYRDMLRFTKKWPKDEEWTVCQVDRGDLEIILCQDESRRDKSRMFIELTKEGFAELLREIEERSIPHRKAWWGYDVIQIDDPDGNELLFPIQ